MIRPDDPAGLMSVRDHLAVCAMQGLMTGYMLGLMLGDAIDVRELTIDRVAHDAWAAADALLAGREGGLADTVGKLEVPPPAHASRGT